MSLAPTRVGVDTGGTFTDLVAVEGNEVRVGKVLSTPTNPARAVIEALSGVVPGAPPASLSYSTTVATNALLERRGARVLLFTTAGFEDILEIGRQARPELYALEPRRPPPLVDAADRIGVAERMSFEGQALVPLGPGAVRRAVAVARRRKPEAVAVCLLHSYANPEHERRLAEALRGAGVVCTASHELGARYREYERFSTAAINAYVAPKMSRHIEELAVRLEGVAFRIMQSNGGALDAATAAREAVRTILSGPAAGVVGARAMARAAGFERIITFDMGGTSTDVCLVDGVIRCHAECSVGGLPINVPAIDVHTVGAGGGSIACRDPGGALAVGPRSAGSEPGPACYGRGEEPTVTDANLVLGRLGEGVLAGSLHLQRDRAEKVIGQLARRLKLSPRDTALGIVQVANAAMERAIRAVSVERGYDPREFVLVAFGGAAPLHACELAENLGIRGVVVPRHAGVLSAWGVAGADVVREYVRTVRQSAPSLAVLRRAARALTGDARRDMRAEGVPARAVRLEALVGLRYAGQSFELEVPLGPRFAPEFHALHRRLYGHADTAREIEAVYVGLRASAPQGDTALAPLPRPERAVSKRARMPVQTSRAVVRAAVLERESLAPGARVPGAAVIQEFSATTYVPPGWSARVDRLGHLVLRHGR